MACARRLMPYRQLKTWIGHALARPFVRSVAVVAGGSAAAQAITIGFAPLLTRLYGPEAFGLQAIFVSVVALLSVVAALGYPGAIGLPRREADALGLARLSASIAVLTSLLTMAMLIMAGPEFLALLNAAAIEPFVLLIPLAMLVSALGTTLRYWLMRQRQFALTARYGVVTTLLVNLAKSVLGVLHPSAFVLISTNTVGNLLSTWLTYWGWRRQPRGVSPVAQTGAPGASLPALAIRYRDFALLRTPQDLINALSHGLPVLVLAGQSGPEAAGQYGIAIAMLGVPAALIGNAVMSVFYSRVNEAVQRGQDVRTLIVRATAGLAAAGALPFGLVVLAGPALFGLVFGEGWQTAGTYAQWLALWLFTQFINQPAVAAIAPLQLQRGLLIYELVSTAMKVLALWIGFAVFSSDRWAVALFSVFGVLAYLWLICWVVGHAGRLTSLDKGPHG